MAWQRISNLWPDRGPNRAVFRFSVLTLLLFASLISSAPLATDSKTGVLYQGITLANVEHFLNIFYAQSTAGQNRFAPPVPYTPSPKSVVNATTPGAACPQPFVPLPADPYTVLKNVSEDCLTLRISRPTGTLATAKLPVMVWLYGGTIHFSFPCFTHTEKLTLLITGGATVGTIYDSSYNPTGLVSQAAANGSPVIYAAINHRVNCE
jgi:hypothetical protein